MSEPFSRLTGIAVDHESNIGLKLPARLLTALEAGQEPNFNVIWSNSVPALRSAQMGWCESLDEETVPNLAALHPRARPAGFDGWPLVLPYVVHYVLVYRRAAFPEGKPNSWKVLLEPRFKGKIALYPGGNGFYPIAQVMGGGKLKDIPRNMSPCWSFLRRLRPQVGELDYSIGMGERIRKGELDICFRALTNAIAFQKEGLDVSWAAPEEGITDTTDAFWVPSNLPENVAFWSKQYINFALSQDTQEKWCEHLGVMPLHERAALPGVFRESPALPRSPDDLTGVLHLADALKVLHELEWEARFNELFA